MRRKEKINNKKKTETIKCNIKNPSTGNPSSGENQVTVVAVTRVSKTCDKKTINLRRNSQQKDMPKHFLAHSYVR